MITVTENAASRIRDALITRGHGVGVRVGIRTSGCSGLAYTMEYADAISAHDHVFTDHDVTIIVDGKSFPYLQGTELDYTIDGVNEGFAFNNPNAKASCGCGESFTV